MTVPDEGGLRAEIQGLANELSIVSPQGKATVFAVCGRALASLLTLVESHTGGRWVFPEAEEAIAQVEAYALGLSTSQEHAALRARLMELAPHGHDLDSPWSTYAQDALICIDAGLAASSIVDSCKGNWIQYSIEPLATSLQYRDEDVLNSQGEEFWEQEILTDRAMASALAFLRKVILRAAREAPLSETQYRELVEEALVLIPASP